MIVSPNELVAHLGAYNLTSKNETGSIRANVAQIFVNPDWEPFSKNFDADLAIVVLSLNITFTDYIRPVCVPGGSADINSGFIDLKGTVVGWGSTKNGIYEDIPRQAFVQALNDSYCYTKDNAMASYSSGRTFCGGFGGQFNVMVSNGTFTCIRKKTELQPVTSR